MSLHAPIVYCIPDDTARVARAAFPKGNTYLRMRDTLGPSYTNQSLLRSFRRQANPPKHRRTWHSSPSCNSRKGSPTRKRRTPSAAGSIGNVRHEVALVEWANMRKEVKQYQPQARVRRLFSPWRASLVTARCEAQGKAQEHRAIAVPQAREKPKGRT